MGSDQAAAGLKNDNRISFPGTGLKIFLGILVLGLTLLTVYMSVIKARYRSDLSSVNESLASLMQQNSLLKQTKIKRVEFLERQFVMNHPRQLVKGLIEFLQALERSFSPPVDLDRLTVTSGDRNLAFRLSGRVRTGERVRAEYLLDQCLNRLRTLEGIIDLELLPLNEEEAAGHPHPFHLQGSVEIE
jgi:hypothetical protein